MAAHRAWRIRADSNNGGGRACVVATNIEFYAELGGADLTDGATGGPIRSTAYNGGYEAGRAFDGDLNTEWHDDCSGAANAYIGWDFGVGNAEEVTGFLWRSRGGGYGNSDSFNDAGLEWSDDLVSWTRVFTVSDQTWGDNESKTFFALPPEPTGTRVEYPYTGAGETFTIDAETTLIRARLFGAAGAGGQYGGGRYGGGGGFTDVEISVAEGDEILVQVAQGGRQYPQTGAYSNMPGGWPDGGPGAYGDTCGGGGGGSSRIWKNGTLMAVAGGGAGAAGYGTWGGPGGGVTGGVGITGSGGTQTAGGLTGDGTATSEGRVGLSLLAVGAVGRTGGLGGPQGSGTGGDGGGGGGGYWGGGGGGGDGNGGGGGSGFAHGDCLIRYSKMGAGRTSGGADSTDYDSGVGYGGESNTANHGGDGLIVLYFDAGEPGGGGEEPTRRRQQIVMN